MWDWFIDFLASVISGLESFIGDWGLAIIVMTVIVRLLLLPLTLRQQKSMADMQIVTPLLNEIQTKYADDPQRLNEEMMKFYAEHKFNPLAGCLPMIIQMPIFVALFTVLRDRLPAEAHFYNILSSLASSPATIFANEGIVACIPYIIFVILFGVLTFLPMYLQQNQNQMTKTMGIVMTIMMLFFGWSSPAGVLLYWVASSAWGVIQQQLIVKKTVAAAEEKKKAELANKPVEVDIVRRQSKPRQHKKR